MAIAARLIAALTLAASTTTVAQPPSPVADTSRTFDAATFQRIHTVNFFEPITSGRTRVTVTQPGFAKGPAYDGVYKFFEGGNRWSLEQLKKTLEAKPQLK